MRKTLTLALALAVLGTLPAAAQYVPSEGNLKARQQMQARRLGIFLHWGIYSTYAQGEWYLSTGKLQPDVYAEAAGGFYPARFDAAAWAKAFKDAGAGYVTLTSRHHDGFSMFDTAATDFDIMDATPFKRDVLAELTEAVKAEGMDMQYYYSLIDWIRPDYPKGHSGVAKDSTLANYNHYFDFEKAQIAELMAHHPRALWFDGIWDHEDETPAFPWRMEELYNYIHSIDPDCLVGNNHHRTVLEGEDFQMFEQDLPGENSAGLSEQSVISATLPLETCATMNWAWGYKVADQNYKSVKQIVHLLVRAASKGANLLLNIGPQANGELPAAALDRLKGLGEWMRENGHTVNGCGATGLPEEPWGVTTRDAHHLYLHILDPEKAPATYSFQGRTIPLPKAKADAIDTIVTIRL
ncbi:MAG: alpha-L-fucosidase [Bacteroidales bacterium]|nr:alpha-L-fucosidase [Bacteroidales bacterium]